MSSSVIRCIYDGQRAVAVGNDASAKTQIGALLDLLHLHLPWWNPYEATGMPLLGETQAAALFPPTLLTALSDGQLYEHVVLELIAGISTYLLLRRIAVTRSAASRYPAEPE